jgi:hypothetical protein
MRAIRIGLLPNAFVKMNQPFVGHIFHTHHQLLTESMTLLPDLQPELDQAADGFGAI